VPPQVASGLMVPVLVEHVPKAVWHPATEQYALVEPHHPAGEQQVPKVEPWHVCPPFVPQLPSVLVGAAPLVVVVDLVVVVVFVDVVLVDVVVVVLVDVEVDVVLVEVEDVDLVEVEVDVDLVEVDVDVVLVEVELVDVAELVTLAVDETAEV